LPYEIKYAIIAYKKEAENMEGGRTNKAIAQFILQRTWGNTKRMAIPTTGTR